MRAIYGTGWERIHPFDRRHGTETSGFIAPEALHDSRYASLRPTFYCGSQPSIVRAVLEELPPPTSFRFVDLGAGKGRPVMVASQLPFKELIGVELSAALAKIARKNLAAFWQRHPHSPPWRIENADAGGFPLPPGNLVLFLYHPFGESVINRVVANVEAALRAARRSLFVIYYNPVYGASFDASPLLTRYYARTLSYAADEQGYGPDTADPVVIWQGGTRLPPKAGADAAIRIASPGLRAELC